MRKNMFLALVIGFALVLTLSACGEAPCPGCTTYDQMGKDAQNVGESVQKEFNKAEDAIEEAVQPALEAIDNAGRPIREAAEQKAYEGLGAVAKTVAEVDDSTTLKATCATVSLEVNTFTLECIVINPVTNSTDETPPMYFIIDGKFSRAITSWEVLDNGNVYAVVTVPDEASGLVFASDKINFVGKMLPGWNLNDGSLSNFGGWTR